MNEEAIRLAEDLAEALRQSDAWAAAGGLLAAKNAAMADEIARMRADILNQPAFLAMVRRADEYEAASEYNAGLVAAEHAENARLRAYIAENGPCIRCPLGDDCSTYEVNLCAAYVRWRAAQSAGKPQDAAKGGGDE